MQCAVCETTILKKDVMNHKRTCAAVRVSCKDCKATYKRGDFAKKHNHTTCLKQQVRQLREQTSENKITIQMLASQLHELLAWRGTFRDHIKTFDFLIVHRSSKQGEANHVR